MRTVDDTFMDAIPGLRLIQQWGAGLEGVDIDAATSRAIAVGNVASNQSGNAESVAEWCVMGMLALARRLPELDRVIRQGESWGSPIGRSLQGSTIGIVGLGGIGTALAKRLRGFEMRVLAVTRRPDPRRNGDLGLARQDGPERLGDLLTESDFVCLCVPLSPATRHLVDSAALSRMKRGSFLINAGRGGLVEEAGLLQSLRSGHLAGAALDVFASEPLPPDSPLLSQPTVLATPHIAGVTERSYAGNARHIAARIVALSNKRPLEGCINWSQIADRYYAGDS
jgi:phosphoglycerate dehydrogenase-like enzyme